MDTERYHTPSPAENIEKQKLHVRPNQLESITIDALQHTLNHLDCPACEATRDEMLSKDPDVLRNLKFSAAGRIWLETRKPYLRPRPFYLAGQHIKHLSVFFGEMPLRKIHIGHIREFQKARTHNPEGRWHKRAGPSIINHETSALQSVLKRAGEWDKIKPHFEALPLPRWKPPKVLSDEQEMLVFAIAQGNPNLELAAWTSSLTVNTSVAGVELRSIQLSHVNMDARIPTLLVDAETAKEEIRGRIIVLNSTAQMMMHKCLKRASELGAYQPEHYLFPFRRAPGHWDPTRPATASWLRRSFEELRGAAGIPWLTPHCFRHQHATLSYEAGEPPQTIRLRMGHTSERMTQYYSSLRRESQKTAVDAIDQATRYRQSNQSLISY
jgi:integrase